MSDNTKDINRYRCSRFKSFQQCPLKHKYEYIDMIETSKSEALLKGDLFHRCIEAFLKKEDMTPIFEEYRTYCIQEVIKESSDMLEYIVNTYLAYYGIDYAEENTLLVEHTFEEALEGDDYLTGTVDQVYERNNLYIIRDMKTTSGNLKYTDEDVMYNQQLLMYVPYVEDTVGYLVDCIEIDEVRFGKLGEVPFNTNGRPSADKRKLTMVTYEDYYNTLCSMGLDTMPEYKNILQYLEERGHPLFNRVRCQLLTRDAIKSNLDDMYNTYKAMRLTQNTPYRAKDFMCKYCQFNKLCVVDMLNPDETYRQTILQKL